MNKEVKEKWIEALRSGEYEQTTEALKYEKGFCCLGVLCDLYGKEKSIEWKDNSFLGHIKQLPDEVSIWADINPCASLKYSFYGALDSDFHYIDLAEANDNGLSFGEIADIIEKDVLEEWDEI